MYFCLTIETKSKMIVKSAIVKPISHDHVCVELGSPLFSTGSVQTCQLGAPQIHTTPVFFIKYSLPLDHLLALVHTNMDGTVFIRTFPSNLAFLHHVK